MNLSVIGAYVAALAATALTVAWLVVKHRTLAHWSFAAGMLLLAADTSLGGLAAGESTAERALSWQAWRTWCEALLPGIWLLYSLCYSRGNYREFLADWRWGIAGAVVAPVALAAATVMTGVPMRSSLDGSGGSWAGFIPLGWTGKTLEMLMLLGMLLTLINLEKTFRSALGLMRWRVKFVVLGLAVILGGRIYASSQAVLFSGIQLSLVGVLAASLLVGTLLVAFSFVRTGLQEIDVYPSHAMLYGSLSVLLAGTYLFVVGLLAEVVARWGGDQSFPVKSLLLLLAVVALAVLFLSDRFRQQAQLFISRHLRRPFYDYRRVWTSFAERTTSRLDRTEYCRAVVTLMAETFNALSVTVWTLDASHLKLQFGASTSLTDDRAGSLVDGGASTADLLAALGANPCPFDLETSQATWVRTLNLGNPDHFNKGGGRVCVPLVAAGQPLGFILLTDRVSGVRFTPEDHDLLKCIGDQVAAGLLNLQLSRKLIEAKELEAFQAMSAFFVHDLKNTASTLSMMLQNLPVHFNNPDFRADALRGIGKSVDRLNGLIERLTLLRQGFTVKALPADLNALVTAALKQFQLDPHVEVVPRLQPLPPVPADPEQLPKVLTNLLLNAREAMGVHGRIEVTTERQDGDVVVSVADNGCGMSSEFVSRRLFRPFQTTKKKGLGIGLFQSRMIIEAHGGRLEVKSEAGRGTTVRVLLPLSVGPSGSPEPAAAGSSGSNQRREGEHRCR